jgi:ribonuclease P protein component
MNHTQDFLDQVMRRGRRISRPGFTIYYLPHRVAVRPRIVVSQKVDKRATVRNKIRRRIRAILRQAAPAGWAIIVITRPEIGRYDYPALRTALQNLLKQIT